ncbi:MAG: condensation domain-containing protein, partial [Aeromonadaceae bacterium]|nr:condensation domain-containing protein [Aeromonadaceae bacterium]
MAEWMPLTQAQQGIWFAMQQSPTRLDFNTGEWFEIQGELNPAALLAALTQLLLQTPSLAMVFGEQQGEPRQRHCGVRPPGVQRLDLRHQPDPWAAALAWAHQQVWHAYDLSAGWPVRLGLARLGEARWGLLVAAHHLVLDGYGYGLLIQQLGILYQAACRGQAWPDLRQTDLPTLLAQEAAYGQSAVAEQDAA